MIAACPKCGARYRIERPRIRPEGVRLRCSRCEAVFRVRAPGASEAPPESATPGRAPAAAAAEPRAPAPGPAPSQDRSRLVVIADPDPERAKRTAAALSRVGLETVLAHDGVEAILAIQRVLPRAVILDAALPKMFGFQVCELMKRNESLRSIRVLLVGSHHHPERYRRAPSELYGADAYLEEASLPDSALETLRRVGLPVSPERSAAPPRPASAPPHAAPPAARREAVAPAAKPASAPTPAPPAARPAAPARVVPAPPVDAALADAVAKAERLARIIVSDIVLYNEERFAEAVRAGNVAEAFAAELAEGAGLLRERVEARVREQRDFLRDELLRAARARAAK
jgi:predicted Zn finger-like uncharacterized protein